MYTPISLKLLVIIDFMIYGAYDLSVPLWKPQSVPSMLVISHVISSVETFTKHSTGKMSLI